MFIMLGVSGAVRGTTSYKWGYWIAAGRSDSAATTHRLKTSSISGSVYSASAVCGSCQDG